jgi:hypothetical protein
VTSRLPFERSETQLGDLVLAIEERRRDDGKIAGVERLQRRKLGEAELVEMLRLGQVLESVLAEGGDSYPLIRSRVVCVRSTWPPWPAEQTRRRAVHVDADVASFATIGSPVWIPMRTRTGLAASSA